MTIARPTWLLRRVSSELCSHCSTKPRWCAVRLFQKPSSPPALPRSPRLPAPPPPVPYAAIVGCNRPGVDKPFGASDHSTLSHFIPRARSTPGNVACHSAVSAIVLSESDRFSATLSDELPLTA